jgi:hypothetical protein
MSNADEPNTTVTTPYRIPHRSKLFKLDFISYHHKVDSSVFYRTIDQFQ